MSRVRVLRLATLVLCAALASAEPLRAEPLAVELELGGSVFALEPDPARGLLYASVPSLGQVVVVSTDSFEIFDRVVVGAEPLGLSLSHDGTRLFVALNGAGAVAVVDLATLAVSQVPVMTATASSLLYDVLEAGADHLFVTASPGSGGLARMAQLRFDAGTTLSVAAGNRIIRNQPVLAASPDGSRLFVGEATKPPSLYALDVDGAGAPIVLEDAGSLDGTEALAVSADGERLILSSGEVLATASFNELGRVEAGIPRVDGDRVLVAKLPDANGDVPVAAFDAASLAALEETLLPCGFVRSRLDDFLALADGAGLLVAGDGRLCGLLEATPALDADADGVWDGRDNCAGVANADQENGDGDELGDACDPFPSRADNLGVCLVEGDVLAKQVEDLGLANEALRTEMSDMVAHNDVLLEENALLAAQNEELLAENTLLAAQNADLVEENAALEAELADLGSPPSGGPYGSPDADGDGVPDAADRCPGTAAGAAVDAVGCSRPQFCAAIPVSSIRSALRCLAADWRGSGRRGCALGGSWWRPLCVAR